MKKRHKYLAIILIITLGAPVFLHLWWKFSPDRPLSVFIMDKSAATQEMAKNRSLSWLLNHYKFVKNDFTAYDPLRDYFGFFALSDSRYEIRDLNNKTRTDIEKLADQYDMAYFTNSYGVYGSDFYTKNKNNENIQNEIGMLYGGLSDHDLVFIEYMMEKNKPVIAEYVFFAPPTKPAQRRKAESLFNIQWKGWSGKFYQNFDPSKDHSVPSWIIKLYEEQYNKQWSYKNFGIILLGEKGEMVVLEYPDHLKTPTALVVTEKEYRKKYGMSNHIQYPGWFDLVKPSHSEKKIISWFELDVTAGGKEILKKYDLPSRFPAVIADRNEPRTIYLAGDFGHTNLSQRFLQIKGARFHELFFADLNDYTDKKGVYFAYYLPFMNTILTDHYQEIKNP